TFVAEGGVEGIDFVGAAVVVGVRVARDDGDVVGDGAGAVGVDADGDVLAVGEGGDFFGAAGVVEVGEDFDRVAAGAVFRGERIFAGFGDPEPALAVEREVHGLGDVGVGGDELDFEAGREVEG